MPSTILSQQQYVWAVQSQAWRETALHYLPREHREEPKYTLISIHTILRSANKAAQAYALDSADLPGGGERMEEDLDFRYDRDGCYVCRLDVGKYGGGYDYDMADVVVRVVRKPLLGPRLASSPPKPNAASVQGRDHNAGKRKRDPSHGSGRDEDEDEDDEEEDKEDEGDDDEVQFVKQVRR